MPLSFILPNYQKTKLIGGRNEFPLYYVPRVIYHKSSLKKFKLPSNLDDDESRNQQNIFKESCFLTIHIVVSRKGGREILHINFVVNLTNNFSHLSYLIFSRGSFSTSTLVPAVYLHTGVSSLHSNWFANIQWWASFHP